VLTSKRALPPRAPLLHPNVAELRTVREDSSSLSEGGGGRQAHAVEAVMVAHASQAGENTGEPSVRAGETKKVGVTCRATFDAPDTETA